MYVSNYPLSRDAERESVAVINHGLHTLDEYGLRLSNIADSHKEHFVIFAMNSTNPVDLPKNEHPVIWLQNFVPNLRIHDDPVLVRNLEEIQISDLLLFLNRDFQKNWLKLDINPESFGRLLRDEISNALRYRIWLIEDQIGSYEELKQIDLVIRILNRINRQLAIFDPELFKKNHSSINSSNGFTIKQLEHFQSTFQIKDVYVSAGEKAKSFHLSKDCEGLTFINYISKHSNTYPPFLTKIETANSNGRKPCRYCFGIYYPPRDEKSLINESKDTTHYGQKIGNQVNILHPDLNNFKLRGMIVGKKFIETEDDVGLFYEVDVRLNPKESKISFFREIHLQD